MDVQGKTALITGSASGIGLGMAEAFAAAGMTVFLSDVERPALEKALAKLAVISNKIYSVELDVTDRTAMADAADKIERTVGPLHVLCNNAGVAVKGYIEDATFDDWDWVTGVNLGGVINGIATFVPRMLAHGEGGHIVNTASLAGLLPSAGNGLYNTTKFAVVGLSDSLRAELGPRNIGVSVLCPASVRTNINQAARNRPGRFERTGTVLTREEVDLFEQGFETGIDPLEIGRMTLEAIEHNRAYILPHQEFRQAFEQRSGAILDAWSTVAPPEERLQGNDLRRKAFDIMRSKKPGR